MGPTKNKPPVACMLSSSLLRRPMAKTATPVNSLLMAAVLVASVEPFAIASKHPPQVKVLTPSSLGGFFEMAGSRTKRIVFLLCILLLTLVLSRYLLHML
ncbi:hypothetical protein GW17_00057194 [Ensete ventricosum]|nr:hypothetical protein GW17_00057194 [Ensete ventricosum]